MWVEISRHAHGIEIFVSSVEREEEFFPPIPSHQPRFNVSTGFRVPSPGPKNIPATFGKKKSRPQSSGPNSNGNSAVWGHFGCTCLWRKPDFQNMFNTCIYHISHMNMLHVYMHDPIRSYGVLECKLIIHRSPNSRKLIRLISVASLEAYMYLNCMYTYTYVHLL